MKELKGKGSIKVVKEPDTRVFICEEGRRWKDDYAYYYATKQRWPFRALLVSNMDFILETVFYLLAFYFVIKGILSEYCFGIIILTFLIDFIVINIALKHLGQKKLFLTSFAVNTIGFLFKWYYSIYSIFTAKKWR